VRFPGEFSRFSRLTWSEKRGDTYLGGVEFPILLDREALIRPIGNTVYLMPPYIVSDEEVAHLGEAAQGALLDALSGKQGSSRDC